MVSQEKIDLAIALRALSRDGDILTAAHVAIEDEAADRRDRGIGVMNRNGIAIYSREGQPSSIIRIGTREAIKLVLETIAAKVEKS